MVESTPTPAPGNGGKNPRKRSKDSVPKADSNFGTTVADVNTAWIENPHITLVYITQAEFGAKAVLYNDTLEDRKGTGSTRPSMTSDLKEVEKKIDDGIDYIKRYLASDFGKNATVHYAKFGIEKVGNGYQLPRDRDKRKDALKLIIPGLQGQGYNTKEYGKNYFTPLIASFNTLYGSTKTTDGSVSGLVSDKNQLKKDLTKVLKSLLKVLEGNYPDTFKAVWRKWGFQKEKY